MDKTSRPKFWPLTVFSPRNSQLGWADYALLALIGGLLFISSLPHAIAARKLLLFCALIIALKPFWRAVRSRPSPLRSAILLLVGLEIWMLVIVGAISKQPLQSFMEWKGQWLPPFVAFIVGIGAAWRLSHSDTKHTTLVIAALVVFPTAAFIAFNSLAIVYEVVLMKEPFNNQYGIGGQKGIISYLIPLCVPLIIVGLFSQKIMHKKILPIPRSVSLWILILACFSLFAASSRNGLIIMALTLLICAVILGFEIRKAYSSKAVTTILMLSLAAIAFIAIVSYKFDPRWKNFFETISIAWHIDRDLLWLNASDPAKLPLTSNGMPVEMSQYNRIAWLHEGWRMLLSHPWGLEIARDTFHKLELQKYGYAEMSHSHNSWIDLGLQIGILGLLLWIGILAIMARAGWRAWRIYKEPLGLALMISIVLFALQGMLDSIFRDHMVEQFMLVSGLFFGRICTMRLNQKTGI